MVAEKIRCPKAGDEYETPHLGRIVLESIVREGFGYEVWWCWYSTPHGVVHEQRTQVTILRSDWIKE